MLPTEMSAVDMGSHFSSQVYSTHWTLKDVLCINLLVVEHQAVKELFL